MSFGTSTLTPYERPVFNLCGKPYFWVRVNGRLELRSALRPDGSLTLAALDRIADGK